MSYIGKKPTSSFASATSQTFTGNNSLTEFTLNRRVSAPEDLEVFVSNVQQQPTTSYTIEGSGLTLKFSEAPPSGQFYIVYRSEAGTSAIDTGAVRTTGDQTITGDLTVTSSDDGAGGDPNLIILRNSTSPADQDQLGRLTFRTKSDTDQLVDAVQLRTKITDVSNDTEDANLEFYVSQNGSLSNRLIMKGNGVTSFSGQDLKLNTGVDLLANGNEVILDADGDTSITADTDDQIDFKVGGTDKLTLTSAGNLQLGSAGDFAGTDDTLQLGGGAFKIYHNGGGGNSVACMLSTANSMQIFTDVVRFTSADNSESLFGADKNAAFFAKYDNGTKIATTPNGIVVGGVTGETHHSSMKSLQVGARGFILPYDSGATYVTSNVFYSTSNSWQYATNGAGSVLSLNNGSTYFYHAVNGSDGGTASLQERGVFYLNPSNNDNYNLFQSTRNSVSHYFMNYHSSDPYGVYIEHPNVAKNNTDHYFMSCVEQGNGRMKIFSSGTLKNATGTYTSFSDERLKSDIVDAKSQWEDIKALKFKNFIKFDNPDFKQIGLVAQDVEKVCPNLVFETPPEPKEVKHNSEFGTLYEEGDTLPPAKEVGHVKEVKSNVKNVKDSILYMKSVKALQEAMARIETLEAKVAALESK